MFLKRIRTAKLCYALLPVFIAAIYSCSRTNNESTKDATGAKGVLTSGYLVPSDSIMPPKVIPAGSPEVVKDMKISTLTVATNTTKAGSPKVIIAGTPVKRSPGHDTFLLPTVVPATGKKVKSGLPKFFPVKDLVASDDNPFGFSSFNKAHGFRHGHVLDIIEDRNGNLWFGGRGGVTRYDGRNFSQFTEKEGLPDLRVSRVMQDKNGNIWFGTYGGGITKYDGASFTNYGVDEGLLDNHINSLFEDRQGNIWVGTPNGACRFDGRSFTHYTYKQGLTEGPVGYITDDKDGNIWIYTQHGINKFDGLSFYTLSKKEGLPLMPYFGVRDKEGNLWMASGAHGVCKYDGRTFTVYTKEEGLPVNSVLKIMEDRNGHLWFTTVGGGLVQFDGQFFTVFSQKQGFPDNYVWATLEDRNGNLWFGTSDGVTNYKGALFRHYSAGESLPHDWVVSVVEDKKQNIWIGANGGGYSKLEKPTSAAAQLKFTSFSQGQTIPTSFTRGMLLDSKNALWVGTASGVLKHSENGITRLSTKQGLPGGINGILEDKAGNMWFGTDKGLCRYDGKTIITFTKKEGLPDDVVNCVMQDSYQNLWAGTNGGAARITFSDSSGAIKYRFTHFTTKEGLSSNVVPYILEDKSGSIWFATSEGITKLVATVSGKNTAYSLTHLTEKNGLSYNFVNSILEDRKGGLWFGTRYGLNKLIRNVNEPATGHNQTIKKLPVNNKKANEVADSILFDSYTYDEGFLGKGINPEGLFEASDGAIWISADDRLTVFRPEQSKANPSAPQIEVNGVQLFNQSIPWFSLQGKKDSSFTLGNGIKVAGLLFDSLSRWSYLPQNLSLAHNNNHVTFSYVGVTMYQPKKVKYQYILQGFDKTWSAITNRTEASYGNLPPGSYTFKVKAANSQGRWSEEYTYSVTIRPPWWRTWWAYSLYGLFLLAGMYAAYRFQRQRLIKKEREKARVKELAQAKEIEKAYSELKATQVQLVQKEKMASLGELTAGIAHEIQNPLNFINNFSAVNKELLEELQLEAQSGNVQEVMAIAVDIEANEEKILHHGRRADNIVKGMLQHSRSSGGEKQSTDINALADEYLKLAYHGFRTKHSSFSAIIETHYDRSLKRVHLAPQEIGRVLLNLFNNAFYSVYQKKALQNGTFEPFVQITTQQEKGTIQVTVKDNGTGIPAKVVEKVFQPFFTTKPTGEGTGLGLSLSYDIITKGHGGELTVRTKEGEGATFIIQLPL